MEINKIPLSIILYAKSSPDEGKRGHKGFDKWLTLHLPQSIHHLWVWSRCPSQASYIQSQEMSLSFQRKHPQAIIMSGYHFHKSEYLDNIGMIADLFQDLDFSKSWKVHSINTLVKIKTWCKKVLILYKLVFQFLKGNIFSSKFCFCSFLCFGLLNQHPGWRLHS